MSDVSYAILSFLGLTETVQSVKNAVAATKQGMHAVDATKKLLATDAGKAWRKEMIGLLAGSSVSDDGTLHLDTKKVDETPAPAPKPRFARGHWEFDGLSNPPYVWVPEK